MTVPCPFCSLPRDRVLDERETAFAIRDGFPVSPGHTLIIPKRHVASFFEVTDAERADLMSLVAATRDDPRGGVRWVLPDKAAYWNKD